MADKWQYRHVCGYPIKELSEGRCPGCGAKLALGDLRPLHPPEDEVETALAMLVTWLVQEHPQLAAELGAAIQESLEQTRLASDLRGILEQMQAGLEAGVDEA
ncbi:MAG: hypothetical protein ACLFTI_02505 [Anaerolineales bacterium]